jgi:hypothetical protein
LLLQLSCAGWLEEKGKQSKEGGAARWAPRHATDFFQLMAGFNGRFSYLHGRLRFSDGLKRKWTAGQGLAIYQHLHFTIMYLLTVQFFKNLHKPEIRQCSQSSRSSKPASPIIFTFTPLNTVNHHYNELNMI